jgi:hypothetical protein
MSNEQHRTRAEHQACAGLRRGDDGTLRHRSLVDPLGDRRGRRVTAAAGLLKPSVDWKAGYTDRFVKDLKLSM